MADLWVMNSQAWINKTYKGVTGVPKLTEDGVTGWATMFALTRALQYELGITALSDTFGPGTQSAYTAKIGSIGAKTKPNVVGILQSALWCKGYTGGTTIGAWNDVITASVGNVRRDVGLSVSAQVDVKLMKSLLTLDAYIRVDGGTDLVRAGQQWLNSRYTGRSDYYLVPCDGRFTRDVQRGLMLAIQYEIGMADGVANGNFGPGTQSGLREQAQIASGSTDGTKKFVSLFQLALAFNGLDVARSGTFSAATRTAALDFQRFLEISATGNGDYGTWAALLVSTGDPTRSVTGMDTTTALTPSTAAQRYAEGYRVVGRYLTVEGKSIVAGELDVILGAGMAVVPIFQNYNNGPSYFTYELGADHGRQAALRARQLGFTSGTVIFFAVDYDAFEAEIDTLIVPYFKGVRDGLGYSVSVGYQIGIYATRNIAARIASQGLAAAVWVSGMSTGYSGNLGYPMPPTWSYNQIEERTSINIDRDAVSVRAKPANRAAVMRTPDATANDRTLYWNIVRHQLLAENALQSQGVYTAAWANILVFAFLMSGQYHYGPFLIYTPYPELMPGFPAAKLSLARSDYFAKAGSISDLTTGYVGDMEHLAVVTQGIMYWGTNAGQVSVGAGDLGGWALDVVQLWANYCKFGKGAKIKDFVETNLGGGTKETSEWRYPDLISDADGYLMGADSLQGVPFAETFARWMVSRPDPMQRLAAFLQQRFTRSDMSLRVAIESNIASLWTAWYWANIPRKEFQEGQPDPTSGQLVEFKSACAFELLSKAGLPTN